MERYDEKISRSRHLLELELGNVPAICLKYVTVTAAEERGTHITTEHENLTS